MHVFEKLGVEHYIPGTKDKCRDVSEWLASQGLSWEETAMIGDDINDIDCLRMAALAVYLSRCPTRRLNRKLIGKLNLVEVQVLFAS